LGTSAEVWIRLQAQYDLEVTREKIHSRLEKIALAPKALASGASKKASHK
jgi:plasmid maintenance system antidote protein VapI